MITIQHTVKDVRKWFQDLKDREEYVIDKSGCKMLEVVGATFIADEETVFGIVNKNYVQREIEWYKSQSRNVYDIPGGAPKEWIRCADPDGMINSNYGYLIWSDENCRQYDRVKHELKTNPDSRRAEMIYTRPSMWDDYNSNGMSDFVCTNSVQYFIREGALIALVQMRSADSVYGFKNDRAWQDYVHTQLAHDLCVPKGLLIWHAGSLHIYQRHFYLVDHFSKTGNFAILKSEYDVIHGNGNDNS